METLDDLLLEFEEYVTIPSSWGEGEHSFDSIPDAVLNADIYQEILTSVQDIPPIPIGSSAASALSLFSWKNLLLGGPIFLLIKKLFSKNLLSSDMISILQNIQKIGGLHIPAKELIRHSQLKVNVWKSMEKMESVLDEEDDFTALCARLLNLVEALYRDLFVTQDAKIINEALQFCIDKRSKKLLERWRDKKTYISYHYISIWLGSLESGWKGNNKIICDYLRSIVFMPSFVFSDGETSSAISRLKGARNSVMHASKSVMSSDEYSGLCMLLLGNLNVSEWLNHGAVQSALLHDIISQRCVLVLLSVIYRELSQLAFNM